MKKVISLFLVMILLTGMLAVSFNALSVSDVDEEGEPLVKSFADGIAEYEAENEMESGSLGTQRVYFQMPNGKTGPAADEDVYLHHPEEVDPDTGEVIKEAYDEVVIQAGDKAPSWYNEHNVLDGKHYAGVYWWGGPANVDGKWVGYRMEIEDEAQGIYYADIPYDPDDSDASVATAIFNNGVDGGTDSSKDIYYQAAQTIDTNVEGAFEGDYDTLPYGSPDAYCFDRCIYVVDPNQVSINAFSQKQTCGANWYVYYGNGCYGEEFTDGADYSDYQETPGWTEDIASICKNPDHFNAAGVHVGYQGGDDPTPHTHTPGEPVRENEVAATYTTEGSYDEVVYCTECGEEISRETKTIDKLEFVGESNKLYFDTNGTGWEMGTKNKVAFHIFGGDLESTLAWGAKKAIGTATAGYDGMFEIDPAAKMGYTFTPGVQYKIIFVRTEGANWTNQTYDLLFTTDCFGHVAFCDGTEYENPVDSSKKTLAAFWKGMDASQVGPVLQISSIGNVVGTCPEEGRTPESIFNDFLTVVDSVTGVTTYQNAYHYVVEPGNKTEQQMIDDIGEGLGLTKQQVYDAFAAADVETAWDYTVSTLPGEVIPPVHEHTPGEAVRENEVPASCSAEGSYDEVVYCSECGEEISRETKTIDKLAHTPAEAVRENEVPASCTAEGSYDEVVYCSVCKEEISREQKTIEKLAHNLTFVPEVPATETATGTKAHYVCSECGKLFSDETGNVEVTAASLIIPMLQHEHTPGEAVQENVVPASCTAEGSYDEVVYCTSCNAELSREHKTIDKTAHTIGFKPGRKATETADGWKSHFYCKVCGKLFADANATNEVTWEQVRIPMIVPTEPEPTDPPTPVITGKLGDVDGDGEVTILDVTVIQRALAGIKDKTTEIIALGDVNGDGNLSTLDATILQRWLLGLEQSRGIGADYKG